MRIGIRCILLTLVCVLIVSAAYWGRHAPSAESFLGAAANNVAMFKGPPYVGFVQFGEKSSDETLTIQQLLAKNEAGEQDDRKAFDMLATTNLEIGKADAVRHRFTVDGDSTHDGELRVNQRIGLSVPTDSASAPSASLQPSGQADELEINCDTLYLKTGKTTVRLTPGDDTTGTPSTISWKADGGTYHNDITSSVLQAVLKMGDPGTETQPNFPAFTAKTVQLGNGASVISSGPVTCSTATAKKLYTTNQISLRGSHGSGTFETLIGKGGSDDALQFAHSGSNQQDSMLELKPDANMSVNDLSKGICLHNPGKKQACLSGHRLRQLKGLAPIWKYHGGWQRGYMLRSALNGVRPLLYRRDAFSLAQAAASELGSGTMSSDTPNYNVLTSCGRPGWKGPPTKKLVHYGPDPTSKVPLSECDGDCDSDAWCGIGLKCFHRNRSSEHVPGCQAGGSGDVGDYDYCYRPVSQDKGCEAYGVVLKDKKANYLKATEVHSDYALVYLQNASKANDSGIVKNGDMVNVLAVMNNADSSKNPMQLKVCHHAEYGPNDFKKGSELGGWGGIYTCPDGQAYGVADNNNACGSLAGSGGTPGECHRRTDAAWSHNSVTCGKQLKPTVNGKVYPTGISTKASSKTTWQIRLLDDEGKMLPLTARSPVTRQSNVALLLDSKQPLTSDALSFTLTGGACAGLPVGVANRNAGGNSFELQRKERWYILHKSDDETSIYRNSRYFKNSSPTRDDVTLEYLSPAKMLPELLEG
jgi:hypothetical protein